MWGTQEGSEKPYEKNFQENLFDLLLIGGLGERRKRSLDILYQKFKIKSKTYRKIIAIALLGRGGGGSCIIEKIIKLPA